MKLKLVTVLLIASALSGQAIAATSPKYTSSQIKDMQIQMQQLQTEIKQLQADKIQNTNQIQSLQGKVQQLQQQIAAAPQASTTQDTTQTPIIDQRIKEEIAYARYAPLVHASPYTGQNPAYDASDLVTNFPSINQDWALLQQSQKRQNLLTAQGISPYTRPLIELSGYVEGGALWQDHYNTPNGPSKTDIDLTGAELDLAAEVNKWAVGFMAFTYDNSPTVTGARIPNSNVHIDRAFATIGNLNETPVYFTIGQYYVPFGAYDNFMITDTLVKTVAKTKERALEMGFVKSGIYASLYGMRGESYTGEHSNINNGGANLGYQYSQDKLSMNIGASYIANMADAGGMQSTGNDEGFPGFDYAHFERLHNYVQGGDVHLNIGYDPIQLVAEYVSTLQSFSPCDLSFNGEGARIQAFDAQAQYKFNVGTHPSFIAAGYGHTWEALGLNVPEQSANVAIGSSLWKDTILKLEYRHDTNYSYHDTASGKGLNTPVEWQERNLVIAHLDVYF
jgi:hypothetical protein